MELLRVLAFFSVLVKDQIVCVVLGGGSTKHPQKNKKLRRDQPPKPVHYFAEFVVLYKSTLLL